MGNTDSIPVVSQLKSLVQVAGGDSAGALVTQENFAYRNTFPVVSQIASAGYAIGGDMDKARDLQEKFASDMERVIDSIPVAGHIKGGVHYALGQDERGEEALKAASRSTGVVLGGVGGLLVGGPVGAVAGGIAGGAAADGVITGSDILAKGADEAKPYGYVAIGKEIAEAAQGGEKITLEKGFDMALMPVSDGVGGYAGGKLLSKPFAPKSGTVVKGSTKGFTVPIPGLRSGYKPGPGVGTVTSLADDATIVKVKIGPGEVIEQRRELDYSADEELSKLEMQLLVSEFAAILGQKLFDNRANQLNPNHVKSGPGRPAGYQGLGTKADLDNHANQLNPNNKAFVSSRNGGVQADNPSPSITTV